MRELIRSLPERAGRGSVQATLEAVARAALAARLAVHADALPAGPGHGPSRGSPPPSGDDWLQARAALAAYLKSEQRLGRVQAGCDPEPVAGLLLDACERRALHLHVLGDSALGSAGGFAAELARTLTRALAPPAR